MGEPLWPYPGTDPKPRQLPVLPAARFAVGERVTTRWGSATVLKVLEWDFHGSRAYLVKHAWSDAAPGFGHFFGEDEMHPRGAPSPEAVAGNQLELL